MKAVITFGRFNPPTIGHAKLIDTMRELAGPDDDVLVFLSHTQDKKKNPLSYKDKIHFVNLAFGVVVYPTEAHDIIHVLKELEDKYQEITLVVGDDRANEFRILINKYNNKEYSFDQLQVVSSGSRDPDADDVAGISASKIRQAAKTGDRELFNRGIPNISDNESQKLYDKIRGVIGIEESFGQVDEGDDAFDVSEEELDFYVDLIDDESLDDDGDDTFDWADELEERSLSIQQRFKMARHMKRNQPKLQRRRSMMQKRMADPKRLGVRARKAAVNVVRSKFAGKQGKNYRSLSPSAKIAVDRTISKKMGMVSKISKRLMPKMRKKEVARLRSHQSSKKESLDLAFDSYLNEMNQSEMIAMRKQLPKAVGDAFAKKDARGLAIQYVHTNFESGRDPKGTLENDTLAWSGDKEVLRFVLKACREIQNIQKEARTKKVRVSDIKK